MIAFADRPRTQPDFPTAVLVGGPLDGQAKAISPEIVRAGHLAVAWFPPKRRTWADLSREPINAQDTFERHTYHRLTNLDDDGPAIIFYHQDTTPAEALQRLAAVYAAPPLVVAEALAGIFPQRAP